MRQGSTAVSLDSELQPTQRSLAIEPNSAAARSSLDDRDQAHGTDRAHGVDRDTAAIQYLAPRLPFTPRLGIVLGSGLGGLAARVDTATAFTYDEIPGWPSATAIGHAGNLILGQLAGVPVAVLQGRLHAYEGHSIADLTLPIRVLTELGVGGWVLSNAAGGLNPRFRRGELMAIDGHIDLTFGVGTDCQTSRLSSETELQAARGGCLRTASPYHEPWLERLAQCARREQVVLHRGTYAIVTGPNYETRAEYRAFRRLGADAVGMSTIPEARCAARYQVPVLALSVITNEAKPDAPIHNDADEVLATARGVEESVERLLQTWLSGLEIGTR